MDHSRHLKKHIGVCTLVSIGVGSIVGSGIFALPAAMAAVAGPGLIAAILLAGIFTLFLALSYAELGASFPITGGPYAYPRMAMGNVCGFLMGWGYYLYLFIGTAAIIDIFVVYLSFYFPILAHGQTLTHHGVMLAVIFLWLLTFINIFGVKWGGIYSIVTTIGKLVPLAIFIIMGFSLVTKSNFVPFFPFKLTGVTLAITLFFWSYTGFESLVVPTDEIKNPKKTIPLSMILTMLIVIVFYTCIGWIFVGMIDWKALHIGSHDWKAIGSFASPLVTVSLGKGVAWLAIIAMVGAIIATAGAGGSWILIQGRLPFAMARDGLFWKPVAKVNPKFGTPTRSILFSSILTTLVLVLIPDFPSVSLIASVTAIVPYSAAMLAVPILREVYPDRERPFKLPFHSLFTCLGFIFSTWLIYWASWPWTVVGSFLIVIGLPVYFLTKKKCLFRRSIWLFVYLIGIDIFSLCGDSHFEFNNFLPISPLGIIPMPWDLILLTLFAIVIFQWARKSNVRFLLAAEASIR